MSNSNRVGLAYVKETTFGVTPSGPPTLKDLRYTGESLGQENNTVTSQEIRADRQTVALVRTGIRSAGALNIELSYGAYDDLLEYSLQSDATWSTTIANTPTNASITSGGVLTSTGGTAIATGFAVNDWIEIRNFVGANNNGYFKISVFTSASSVTLVGGVFTNETTVAGVTGGSGGAITNGVLLSTLAIEKSFQDLSSEFEMNNGMAIDQMSLDLPVDNIIKGSFGFLGKRAISSTTTAGTGSNTASAQNFPYNGVDNVVKILENYSPFTAFGSTLQLQNNIAGRLVYGNLGAVSLRDGSIGLTGTLRAYYTDKAIIDKALNQTQSALSIVFEESLGVRAYAIDLPAIKYNNGKRVAGGINQDVIADMSWTAFRHSTEGKTIRITRFA